MTMYMILIKILRLSMLDKYGGKVINIDFVKFEEQGEVVAL